MAPYLSGFVYLVLAVSLAHGFVLKPGLNDQQFLKPQGIPDGELVTVDSTWFSDDTTSGTTILVDGDLEVTVPVPVDVDPPPEFEDYCRDVVQQSLPGLLALFGIDDSEIPSLVDDFVPLAHDAIIDAVAGPGGGVFREQGIFADITAWARNVISKATNIVSSVTTDVVCSVVAAGVLPAYEAANLLFMAQNTGTFSAPTTNDQDFYISPLHGSVSHDDSIEIFYNANFIIGFGGVSGVTMGKRIYVNKPASSANEGDRLFVAGTRLLLHEFTHTKQYQALGYWTVAFGTKYLFNWCKGGGYDNSPMEREANVNEVAMENLLSNAIGKQFLPIYNQRGLQSTLGLPVSRTYRTLSSSQYELDFQFGTMPITCFGNFCS